MYLYVLSYDAAIHLLYVSVCVILWCCHTFVICICMCYLMMLPYISYCWFT